MKVYKISNDELYNKLIQLVQTYQPSIVEDSNTIDIRVQNQSLYKFNKLNTNIQKSINKR